MDEARIGWLLASDEPWTRYRALIDLQGLDRESLEIQAARTAMVQHPRVQDLIASASSWPGYGLKRHNDAKHPLHQIAVLADFGLRASDPGMAQLAERLMSHQDASGPFQTYSYLYRRFAGVEGEHWTWMMCDAPTVLYALLRFGKGQDARVQRAVEHLLETLGEGGWPCAAGPPMKVDFKSPGKREDPCPYANLLALRVLAQLPAETVGSQASAGIEVLLRHWDHAFERKLFLFGTGTDFRKLKYPHVWYDILHVADVLSQFPSVPADPRFQRMIECLAEGADEDGRYTASSMYRAWSGWSFADKKAPSPWLTLLVWRALRRTEVARATGS